MYDKSLVLLEVRFNATVITGDGNIDLHNSKFKLLSTAGGTIPVPLTVEAERANNLCCVFFPEAGIGNPRIQLCLNLRPWSDRTFRCNWMYQDAQYYLCFPIDALTKVREAEAQKIVSTILSTYFCVPEENVVTQVVETIDAHFLVS